VSWLWVWGVMMWGGVGARMFLEECVTLCACSEFPFCWGLAIDSGGVV